MRTRCSGRSSRTASTRASRTRARRRCTSSPRSTTFPRCAGARAVRRASPPAPPTATGAWPGKPAATLLHLGPGLGNGLANLHNARRARTPIVNIVGDHATYHQALDAPLASDIVGVARNVSRWVRESKGADTVGADAAEAISEARRGGVATLILPADASWSEGAEPGPHDFLFHETTADTGDAIERVAAKALRSGEPTALLLGGRALTEECLVAASAIAAATGAKLLCETFPARLERGAGPARGRAARLPRRVRDRAAAGHRHLVLVDAKEPVSFFAYPNLPSELTPEGCAVHELVPDGVRPPTSRSRCSPTRSVDARRRRGASPAQPARSADRARSTPRRSRRRSARCCPRARSSATRRTPPACSCPVRPRARRATTG